MSTITERRDRAYRCQQDFLAAKGRIKSDVADLTTQLTAIATVAATGSALLAEDPDCGLSTAEVAEWQQLVTDAQAAMGQYAAMIDGLLGG